MGRPHGPRRHLLSVNILDRIRREHAKMIEAFRNGETPPPAAMGAYLTDVSKLLAAYETASDRLRAVLTYHVVSGKVTAADVAKLNSAKTLEGEDVPVSTSNGIVHVGSATVTTPDVIASNGRLHAEALRILHGA